MDYFSRLDYRRGGELILRAQDQQQADRIWLQWAIQLPTMALSGEYISLQAYTDQVTGANIDTRPTSVIMAELDEIEKQFQEGGVENGA